MVETGLIIAYGSLLTMACIPIYAGSFESLKGVKRPKNAAPRKKSKSPLDDSDSESESITESLSANDAWMFPVFGSGVLFSLYLLFRFLNKEYINYLLTGYFAILGCAAVAKVGLLLAKKTLPFSILKHVEKYKVTISNKGKHLYNANFTAVHAGLLTTSILLTVYYVLTKNWIASNFFGICFALNAIQLLSLDSFKTGMILLSGLFFYDIFWVFGTEVMVSVAKNFDAPIKVVWPKDIIGVLAGTVEKTEFTMLGLGDIVIPGIFVALCLRFDHHQAWQRNPTGNFRSTNFSRPYFTSCAIAYITGLVTTVVVMHTFQAAQPALLYLSPACILSTLLTAAVRGELKELFAYSTEEDNEEAKKSKKSEKKEETVKEEKRTVETVDTVEETDKADEADVEDEDYVAVNADDSKGASPKVSKKKKGSKKKGGK
ncbi:hypothetical protein INT44_004755 [Umbelopsis vinacea]|uniref:Minor histocompatibility antigen H13 n=1 Tax=Umbelopsis vinacea TaxID=44442 RepID=A0A8H7UL15_9FUNG|nr:hypothetical protein INT44_004755 [Umbelopsis vinacea]